MVILAVLAAFVAVIFLILGVVALRRRRLLGSGFSLLGSVVLLLLAALFTLISVSTQGYRALTREELALTIRTRPTGPARFNAVVTFPDGREVTYELRGDELYVDAHILKWRPLGNFLGLHTAYELDRISGRYSRIEEEQGGERTVRSLAREKPVNMFHLRRRYAFLAPLVDTEYGSASFVPVRRAEELEVRVSTSGLLIRRVP